VVRILLFSTLYPNAAQPLHGLFVEQRLLKVRDWLRDHGTQPLADIYFDLKPQSVNLGAVDYEALIASQPQTRNGGPAGFQLFRIGDAVESRNIHAAIYDALRLVHVM